MSTTDRRRRLGPANAIPLTFPTHATAQPTDTESSDKLYIQLSNIPTATGSSFIQSGNNILLASVYGPRPSFKRTFNSKAVIKISFHSSPFLSTRKSGNSSSIHDVPAENQIIDSVVLSTLESACANLILLENYPKSTIDIFVNLINTDNNTKFIDLLPLIHNAVNLALVDSGVALKNFPAAVLVKNSNLFINSIHSNTYEESNADLENEELLAFYIPNSNSILDSNIQPELEKAISQARELRVELSQFCLNRL